MTDDIEKILGTKPRSFMNWIKESKSTLFKRKSPPPDTPRLDSPVLKLQDVIVDKQMLLDVVLKMRKPLSGVEVGDRTQNYKLYKKCFYGLEFDIT